MHCDVTQVLTVITDDNAHRIAAEARGEQHTRTLHFPLIDTATAVPAWHALAMPCILRTAR
jgi:hypothetical protein